MPRVFLDTPYSPPSGATHFVAQGADLQAALDAASPGDTIVLEAGATFVGNFILRPTAGSRFIYVRTSAPDSSLPAPGRRVDPSYAPVMPKILSPNSMPALRTAGPAHHFRFVGIEFGLVAGTNLNYGIIDLGASGSSQTSLSQVPNNIVIDRCYIHGNDTGDVIRGVALNSARTAVIDSYISNIHAVGYDTQAVCGWNGPGPFKIVNNYLEAAGENVMFGGADPSIPNLVPSDIELSRNHLFKPLSWKPSHPTYAGIRWTVKNSFELKNARRILVSGNVFENCWPDGQTGFALVFTPRNQNGTAPWSGVQDVTFTNNKIVRASAGLNIMGRDDTNSSQQTMRVQLRNNVFEEIGESVTGGSGRLFQILSGTSGLTIDHTTAFNTGNVITAEGAPNTGFTFTNNITPHNDYGVVGTGSSTGTSTLNRYFPGYSYVANVMDGGRAEWYPAGNYFLNSMEEVGFVDFAGGNYRLSPSSPYAHSSTDGRAVGADVDAMENAFAGVSSSVGIYSGPSGAWFLRNTNTPGAADDSFRYGPGSAGLIPITGDWDGDGVDTLGLYSPSTAAFFLKNSNSGGRADVVFTYGAAGAGFLPVCGDWDGDGVDTVGLYQPATGVFSLKNSNAGGGADIVFAFGGGGASVKPLAGDWDGNGTDSVGLYDAGSGRFSLKYTHSAGPADVTFGYGGPGAAPVSGDWNGDLIDTVGIFNPSTGVFFLRNSNSPGVADIAFSYGFPGVTPLAGNWDGN